MVVERGKMVMQIWVKPSGVEIAINPENIELAKSLGWVPKDQVPILENVVELPKRRGRPPKVREA
jgi:hypothetical protein